jgi:hypothetical protein
MKSKYFLPLAMLVAFTIVFSVLLDQTQLKNQCLWNKKCCPKDCRAKPKAADNSDNIFDNPINRLIVAVY